LIVIEGEAALEVRLDFDRAAANIPGAVRVLGSQEKTHTLLIGSTVNGQEAAFSE
jgi:hypothetical protein